jgi:hypothetical protein
LIFILKARILIIKGEWKKDKQLTGDAVMKKLYKTQIGEGKFSHRYYSCGKVTEQQFGHDTVLLTVNSDEPNEWVLIKTLNEQFNCAGFQPW